VVGEMFQMIRDSWREARAIELRKEYDNSMSQIVGLSIDVAAMLVHLLALEYNKLIDGHGNLNNLSADYKKKLSKSYLRQARRVYDQNMSQGFAYAHIGMYLEAQTIKGEDAKYVVDMSTEMIRAALKEIDNIQGAEEENHEALTHEQDTDKKKLITSTFNEFILLKSEVYTAIVDGDCNYNQDQQDLIATEAAVVSLIVVMRSIYGSSNEKIHNQSSYCFYTIIELMADQVCDNKHDSEEFIDYFINSYTEAVKGRYDNKEIIIEDSSKVLSDSIAATYVNKITESIEAEGPLLAEILNVYSKIASIHIELEKELKSIQ
jgi:nucleoid DNA-binding protein